MTEKSPDLLSPSQKLLLCLCRTGLTPAEKEEISRLAGEVNDWDLFVNLANKHGIVALTHKNLAEAGCSGLIPAGTSKTLYQGYLSSLARNTALSERLDHILHLARQEGIRIILLKGMALEKTIYGDRGLRQMNDIDLLTDRKDAVPLRNLLLSEGYWSIPFISPLHEKIMPSYGKHLPEMYLNGVSVEIHFNLFEGRKNKLTEEFLKRAVKQGEKERGYYVPEPCTGFLYLIKHLVSHEKEGASQLRLYADLVNLIRRHNKEILTLRLYEDAVNAGLELQLYSKLKILSSFWGIKLPSWVESLPRNQGEKELAEKFAAFLRKPEKIKVSHDEANLLKPVMEIPGVKDKLLFIAGYIFPSVTFMRFRYKTDSGIKAMLYYPVRLLRLISISFRIILSKTWEQISPIKTVLPGILKNPKHSVKKMQPY